MPLRALFNPSLYGGLNVTTARVYLNVSAPAASRGSRSSKRAHSTAASAPAPSWSWSSPTSTSPAHTCCPHHKPFNADHTYWRHHSPRLHSSLLENPAIIDKFHEIEQLYRGNVEYVRRMGKDSPGLLEGLAFQGQRPPFMILDCSDSRVNEQGIFGAEPGTMFTAGNIANMFDEADVSSNSVLTYAVTTLKVKHVVVMGHYGCGGVAASMAPLPRGYRERYLSPASLYSSPASSSASPSLSLSLSPTFDDPPDLAVQRWIAPIRYLYETSGRWEIRNHREKIRAILEDGDGWGTVKEEDVAKALMGPPGEEGEVRGVKGLHLHDPAFRALVEENVKANVWRLTRSLVIREHHTAYASSLASPEHLQPLYVHGWVYDLETGVVTDMNVSAGPPGWVPPPGGVQGGSRHGSVGSG
ncbi:hypothetical protein FA13DRAFT_1681268 [Coprinellus micaceus]|uniref:carbonic anhydrase n=1 Tax=Coprinellus micaceus TaxID=71717 RepID=A0A4Y7TVY4_COPMI|nr:hypothetical protein FA13DRAFT_1681268 [Coprinellus micaceus]